MGNRETGVKLAGLYAFARGKEIGAVSRTTEMVIEGFPRSANTYAYAAFVYAQRRNVRVAHHVHGAAQVSLAARMNIPVILLIREPRAAVASLAIRDKSVTIAAALDQYVRFYQPVVALRNSVVVAPFDHVIGDFGKVIAQVNDKFGTCFSLYEKNPESEQAIARIIDDMDRKDTSDSLGSALSVARPTEQKRREKERLESEFSRGKVSGALLDAESLYGMFISG